jgi:hypothetical protein
MRSKVIRKTSLLTTLVICGLLAQGCRSGRVRNVMPEDPGGCLFSQTEIWSDPLGNGQDIIVEVEIPNNKPGADVEIELEDVNGTKETFVVESPPGSPSSRVIEGTDILFVRTRCVNQPGNDCVCNYDWDVSLDV